jgi:hypothetical protein
MKLKKEYLILVAVLVALILYISLKNTDRTHYDLPEFSKIDKADITKLVVNRSEGPLTLQRSGEKWTIEPQGYPADQTQVDQMLNAAGDLTLTSLVSESRNYSQYELSDKKKIKIEVYTTGGLARQFDIGKTASTYRHTFVRLPDDPRVYQARDNLRQPFEAEVERLRDKVVSAFDKDLATAVTIADSSGTLQISKREVPPVPMPGKSTDSVATETGPIWQTADGRAADDKTMDNIIATLSNLRCNSYLEGKSKSDYSAPIFSISVESDKPVSLEVYRKQEDNLYPAVSSQNDYPFLLAEWTVKRLMKKPDEILKKTETKK